VSARPALNEAGYLSGLQCERRLWLGAREPERAEAGSPSVEEILSRAAAARRHARELFPGGTVVREMGHAEAVETTGSLLRDRGVPAIFAAAFEHGSVRVRVDVVERLEGGSFRLYGVSESARAGEDDLDAIALALFAARGSGLLVARAEIIHVDESYVRGPGPIDWSAYFARREVTREAEFLLEDITDQVARFTHVIELPTPPEVEPSPHCRRPWPCEFRAHCLRGRPEDWIDLLPSLRSSRFHALREAGFERISEIPGDFPLAAVQERARDAHRDGELAFSADLKRALADLGPPSDYLDFEAIAPAIPTYAGTRPYQVVPFGWSLHQLGDEGDLVHSEFLARGDTDPRREFSESLIAALGTSKRPVIVYSPFEGQVLRDLAEAMPDLAELLKRIRRHLRDLYEVVRNGVYHVEFAGSFSLKRVAGVLSPGFGYGDLSDVSQGGEAARAFEQIARGELDAAREERTRSALRAYCARDSEALAVVHRALRVLVDGV
jgi:hypothetical protein